MGDEQKTLLKVYVKVPFIINEVSQIKELHKDIKVVRLPRQKSARFCTVVFKDIDTKKKVVSHLRNLVINNKKVRVKPWKLGKSIKPKPQYKVLRVKPNQAADDRLSLLKKEEK